MFPRERNVQVARPFGSTRASLGFRSSIIAESTWPSVLRGGGTLRARVLDEPVLGDHARGERECAQPIGRNIVDLDD